MSIFYSHPTSLKSVVRLLVWKISLPLLSFFLNSICLHSSDWSSVSWNIVMHHHSWSGEDFWLFAWCMQQFIVLLQSLITVSSFIMVLLWFYYVVFSWSFVWGQKRFLVSSLTHWLLKSALIFMCFKFFPIFISDF